MESSVEIGSAGDFDEIEIDSGDEEKEDEEKEDEDVEMDSEAKMAKEEKEKLASKKLNNDRDRWLIDKFKGLPDFKNLSNYGEPDDKP